MFRRLPALIVLLLLSGALLRPAQVQAQSGSVTANDLILAMNTLRVAMGNQTLIVDPVVMSVAQATADTMAAYEMSWHIGDVRGRIASAGYGNGATVWATENFAVSAGGWGIDQIMLAWADPDHMLPATNPAYCHVGAGVSTSANGKIYYVLQAAYVSGSECGPITYPGGTGGTSGSPPVSQVVIPVKIATPDAEGKIFHEVKSGQSFWAIAVAYQVTIADIEFWNNLSRNVPLKVGTILFIPGSGTEGYVTPTPVGMVVPAAPDAMGVIVHIVEPYHTLISIAAAYHVQVDTILALNGWNVDWPLSIGQELLIDPGDVTPTPLSPLARLTPAEDGNYYHTVQSGETLSYIAALYGIAPAQLIAWNGLTADAVIFPDQLLLLQVTPPAPPTATPGPPTVTPTLPPTSTPTDVPPPTRTPAGVAAVSSQDPSQPSAGLPDGLMYGVVLALVGLVLLIGVFRRRKPSNEEG